MGWDRVVNHCAYALGLEPQLHLIAMTTEDGEDVVVAREVIAVTLFPRYASWHQQDIAVMNVAIVIVGYLSSTTVLLIKVAQASHQEQQPAGSSILLFLPLYGKIYFLLEP